MTFGHGTLERDALAALVRQAGIELVADVRTVPKSRTHPWVWREAMEAWIPEEARARYVWVRALGGFRKTSPDSPNTALRNDSFRGYADYMEGDAFRSALTDVLDAAKDARTAVMCSETLWWRCHRRLIADAATLLHGVEVRHLLPNGRLQPHVLTAGVRRAGDVLRYDGAAA